MAKRSKPADHRPLFSRPGFLRWATVVVSLLIVLALVALGALVYELYWPGSATVQAGPGSIPDASTPLPGKDRASTPTPAPARPAIGPTGDRSTYSSPRATAPHDTPPTATPGRSTTPVQPARPGVTDTATPAPELRATPAALHGHPTYEPTTEPCESCHQDIRPGGG